MKEKIVDLIGKIVVSISIIVAALILAGGFSDLAKGITSGGDIISQGLVMVAQAIKQLSSIA